MMADVSRGGINRPWHRGQSGQPNPDSVTRTTPPRTTKANAANTVNSVRPRNREPVLPASDGVPDACPIAIKKPGNLTKFHDKSTGLREFLNIWTVTLKLAESADLFGREAED